MAPVDTPVDNTQDLARPLRRSSAHDILEERVMLAKQIGCETHGILKGDLDRLVKPLNVGHMFKHYVLYLLVQHVRLRHDRHRTHN